MNPLRHLLLVVVLFVAQLAAGAHAIEHAASKEGPLPNHVCELCLAAHDLGSALPAMAAALPPALPQAAPDIEFPTPRAALPPPLARQGAPPRA